MSNVPYFRRSLAVALLSLGLVLPAAAAPASGNGANHAEVEKAENYLNAIGTLKARFMQAAPNGDVSEGTVYLARPGRLRLDYDPPSPILVVTHGTFLVYYDKQLQQTSYVDVDSTPAGVLVRPQVHLDQGDLQVTKVAHQGGLLLITVVEREDPGQGSITLIFTQEPFQLRQWRVVDQQGQITTVSLSDAHPGVSIDNSLFVFKDPTNTGQPDLSTKGK